MGLPLLNGFIGEFMILQGTFASQYAGWVYAAFAVSGIVLGAACTVRSEVVGARPRAVNRRSR